ncbi:hypothetical protein Peur_065233 [Populus x canadensis]
MRGGGSSSGSSSLPQAYGDNPVNLQGYLLQDHCFTDMKNHMLSSPFHSHRSSSIGGWQHRQPLFPSSPETTNSLRRELSPFLLIASDNTTQQQLPVSFLSNASSNDARTATVEDHHARQQQQQPDRSVFGCFFFNLREVDRR